MSCFPPAAAYGLPVKNCANNQKFYLDVTGEIYSCNYITDQTNRLGNYLHRNGILNALMTRYIRYHELFDANQVINNCPSKRNYEGLKMLGEEGPSDCSLLKDLQEIFASESQLSNI